jgi:hypothetical protein
MLDLVVCWRNDLATPNYSFEKRQRELAKKRKQEEKRQKKLQRQPEPGSGEAPAPDDALTPPPTDDTRAG